MKCLTCDDTGHVCENHPDMQWPDDCDCGAGMPCLVCCDPIPQDGTYSIAEAFTPEVLFDCEGCGGEGYIARTVQVYEAGCGFSHPDVEEVRCQACGGNGWFVCEAEGDR